MTQTHRYGVVTEVLSFLVNGNLSPILINKLRSI